MWVHLLRVCWSVMVCIGEFSLWFMVWGFISVACCVTGYLSRSLVDLSVSLLCSVACGTEWQECISFIVVPVQQVLFCSYFNVIVVLGVFIFYRCVVLLGGVMVFVSLPGFSIVGRTRLVVVAVQGAPHSVKFSLSPSLRDRLRPPPSTRLPHSIPVFNPPCLASVKQAIIDRLFPPRVCMLSPQASYARHDIFVRSDSRDRGL